MNSSRIILLAIVVITVVIGSIVLGYGVAANQSNTLIIAGCSLGLLVCIFLGTRIWMLFIFLISMEIPIIRGLTTVEIGHAILVGFSALLFLMRKFKAHYTLTELDYWRAAIAMVIIQVFIRNPVGLNLFGASSVGGKPYFIAASALLAGIVISKYKVRATDLKWSKWVAIAASFIAFPLNSWRYGLRSSGPNPSQVTTVEGMEGGGAGRDGSAGVLSQNLSVILVSKISPLRACFHPFWGCLVLATLAFAALSGYRNNVAYVGLMFLIGIAYHGGLVSLIISSFFGVLTLVCLAFLNLAYPLPPNIQRALSPFPGTWEERFVEAGEKSTEWRVEMWKEALLTDEWIRNKAFGDGLGMSKEDLEKIEQMDSRGGDRSLSGLTTHQQNAMIQGNYHSGPVQTIRTVGYFGLFVLLVAFVRLGIIAHRQIMRCRGTEWQSTMLFFGVPSILFPIMFTFIFGTFESAVSFFFVQSGLIDLFRNNLPLPAYQPSTRAIHRPVAFGAAKNRNAPKLTEVTR